MLRWYDHLEVKVHGEVWVLQGKGWRKVKGTAIWRLAFGGSRVEAEES